MENLLPILILIIWVAFTLYNKGKKKPAAKQTHSEGEQEKNPLSILEQILLGEQLKEEQPYIEYVEPEEANSGFQEIKKIKTPKPKPRPFLNEELRQFKGEGQPAGKFDFEAATTDNLMTENEILEEEFDIRKAVIYHEILNTPYIGYK